MSKIEKLIAKIENYKSGNKIEFSDLEKYLKYFVSTHLITPKKFQAL